MTELQTQSQSSSRGEELQIRTLARLLALAIPLASLSVHTILGDVGRNSLAHVQSGGEREIERQKALVRERLQNGDGTLEEKITQINTNMNSGNEDSGYLVRQEKSSGHILLYHRPSTHFYLISSMAGWCDPVAIRDGVLVSRIEL